MELQTSITTAPSPHKLHHSQPLLLVGSCFTESIGAKLSDFGFSTLVNPFGILYNPLSIAECLRRCLAGEEISEHDLVEHNGLWHSWLHHGSFSAATQEDCLARCNQVIREAHAALQQPHTIIVTLGTAYAYFLNDGSLSPALPVANCHKVPASRFTKRLLSLQEITTAFDALDVGSHQLIFTVSPIRHWADGAHGNQLSKSTLLLAINQMRQALYFPSYEIMMDELRDYRFYDRDMLHPSPLAVDIIWQKFQDTFLERETLELGKKHSLLHSMKAHRPLFPESEAYQRHLQKIAELEHELNTK